MENNLYTAGDLAKLTGVTTRTIRFYDRKNLLSPVQYSEGGYRLYNQQSLQTLQRILVFKRLGFQLNEIENMLQNRDDLAFYLTQQKEDLEKQKEEITQQLNIISMVVEADKQGQWNKLANLLFDISNEDAIKQQYETTTALKQRINIHNYSTSSIEWFDFVISQMELREYDHMLEIDCGTGRLWEKLIPFLPNHVEIILTDFSENMLISCEKVFHQYASILKEKNIHYHFLQLDANNFTLEKASFDVVIANHVLYHITNRKQCIKMIAQGLKPNGTFYCSTIGEHHMKEMYQLMSHFNPLIENPTDSMTSGFRLENALPQLIPYFKDVKRVIHENDLKITEVKPIIEYIKSLPGNAYYIIEKNLDEFTDYLNHLMKKDGSIYIRKSTGMFIAKK